MGFVRNKCSDRIRGSDTILGQSVFGAPPWHSKLFFWLMREILIKRKNGMWPFKNLRDPIFRHDKKETKEITTATGKKDEVAVKTANGQTLADHIRIPGKYEWRRIERGNNSVACNQSTTFPSIHILNRDFTDVRIAETRRANAKCLYLFTSNRRI